MPVGLIMMSKLFVGIPLKSALTMVPSRCKASYQVSQIAIQIVKYIRTVRALPFVFRGLVLFACGNGMLK